MKKTIDTQWLALLDYEEAASLQQMYVQKITKGETEVILGLEHPAVITLGKRGGIVRNQHNNIPIVQTQRGGLATAHEPGQLVVYPIINIQKRNIPLRRWVEGLEDIILSFLGEHTLHGRRAIHPGIWIDHQKIASIGLQIINGISTHGLAINIQNSLDIFSTIEVCGQKQLSMVSMREKGCDISPQYAFFSIAEKIKDWLENS